MDFNLDAMAVVLDSDDAAGLADFYARLLGWTRIPNRPGDEWIVVVKDNSLVLTIQQVDDYERPVWPGEPGRQQQMMHLDFYVEDTEAAIAHAISCGAVLAQAQFGQGHWTTLIDPAGHPFCIIPKLND